MPQQEHTPKASLTSQAVHSGADLDAAVRSVMGYDAVSMKGKKIKVEPVAGVATPELGALLDAALEARAAVVGADPPVTHSAAGRFLARNNTKPS